MAEDADVLAESGDADPVSELGGASDEDVAYAKMQGWVPKADFKGDPDKWVDAKTFAENGRQFNGILRQNNKRLMEEIATIKKDTAALHKYHVSERKSEVDRLEGELKTLRRQAITDGDGAAFDRVEEGLAKLADARTKLAASAPADGAPSADQVRVATEWKDRNPWIESDKKKATIALAVTNELMEQHPELKGNMTEFFATLDRELVKQYPEVFAKGKTVANPSRVTDGAPAGGNGSGGSGKQKGYKDMPKEYRDTADRLVNQKMLKSVDDYAKHYWADQENANG